MKKKYCYRYVSTNDSRGRPVVQLFKRVIIRAAALLIAEIERIDREHVKWSNRPATSINVGDEILFNGCRQVVNGLSVVDYGGSRLLFELSRSGPVHFYMSDYVTVAQH